MKRSRCLALLLVSICLLTACSADGFEGQSGTEAPTRLDLSNEGLSDVTYLQEYTWLSQLDLRGNEIGTADYDALRQALPDCQIRWSVPIAGERIDSDATVLRLKSFSEADAEALKYFDSLTQVTIEGCTDYSLLTATAARYENVDIQWDVKVGTKTVASSTTSLKLGEEAMDLAAICALVDALPALAELDLREQTLSDADKSALRQAYPHIFFGWTVEVLEGVSLDSAETALDLRGHTITDVDALIAKLSLLPALENLDMCECGPSNDEMMRIREALPDTKVVWMIDVAGYRIRTDIVGFSTGVITRFPNGAGYRTGSGNYARIYNGDFDNLQYCTDLIALDFGHCYNVTDMSFVAKLPKLKYLVFSKSGVADISALAVQTELEYLEFTDNQVRDISVLENCTKITYLCCSNNPFTDMSPILLMKGMERLFITASALSDEDLQTLVDAFPDAYLNISRDRTHGDHLWRRGNWPYVDMQRLYGMRAQFQYGITPSPAP